MTDLKQLLENGNVSITISANDLLTLFAEVAKDVAAKEKAQQEAMAAGNETVTQSELCERLNVSKATVWRWTKTGYLKPCGKIGHRPIYSMSDVTNLIKKGV